jgi:hypothetical protein
MTQEKGCFNCGNRQNIGKLHFKCTEPKSSPNLDDPEHLKGIGHISDIVNPIKGNGGRLFFCGCICPFWNPNKVKVDFT